MLCFVWQSHLVHVEPKQVLRTEVFCMYVHAYYEIRTGNNNDVNTQTLKCHPIHKNSVNFRLPLKGMQTAIHEFRFQS